MNQAMLRAPWEFCKAALGFAAVASNSLEAGASIDRTGYDSLTADVPYSFSGAPTGGTLTLQLQDSADGATFANYGSPVVVPITSGAAGIASLALDIRGARQYVRPTVQGAPTGGTAPVASVACSVRLFGADSDPAS